MAGALKDKFVVGIVRGSHGVTGEFKVESTSGEMMTRRYHLMLILLIWKKLL